MYPDTVNGPYFRGEKTAALLRRHVSEDALEPDEYGLFPVSAFEFLFLCLPNTVEIILLDVFSQI